MMVLFAPTATLNIMYIQMGKPIWHGAPPSWRVFFHFT